MSFPCVDLKRYCGIAALTVLLVTGSGCGSSASTPSVVPPVVTPPVVTPSLVPIVAATATSGGAQIISLSNATSGATMYYTMDGSTPTATSTQYLAPFLLTASATLNAIGVSGNTTSAVATQTYSLTIPSGTLVWSDEFTNTTGANAQPNPAVWSYDTGATGNGNMELQDYCAWGSTVAPCTTSAPNAFVGTDNVLHIVALQPSPGVYTSARLKTQGQFSMSYGRLEARMMIPEGQGFWPAFWLMGNNLTTVGWPICGELDVMEHINAPSPDYVLGSVHMPGSGGNGTHQYTSSGYSAAGWHTYGMIWTKGSVQFYVDSPSNIYANCPAAYFPSSSAAWPFDSGNPNFIILNLSVGGTLPGSPNTSTPFPSQLLVDYVRIYTN